MNGNQSFAEYVAYILGKANDAFAELPEEVLIHAERLANTMTEYAERQLNQVGPGAEAYDNRPFLTGIDDPKRINPKLSARHMEDMVTERQAEMRQPVFLWQKSHDSMAVKYGEDNAERLTKKDYATTVLLATAMAVAMSADKVGALDADDVHYGANAVDAMSGYFCDVNILTGNAPLIHNDIPFGSNVIILTDFLGNEQEQRDLEKSLSILKSIGVNGQAYMILDPEELRFPFEGHMLFKGLDAGGHVEERERSQSLREKYIQAMNAHIDRTSRFVTGNGFSFDLQTTDKPPADLLQKIFGLSSPAAPSWGPGL